MAGISTLFMSNATSYFAMDNMTKKCEGIELHEFPLSDLPGTIGLIDITEDSATEYNMQVTVTNDILQQLHYKYCNWEIPGDKCKCKDFSLLKKVIVGKCGEPIMLDVKWMSDGSSRQFLNPNYEEKLLNILVSDPDKFKCWVVDDSEEGHYRFCKNGKCLHSLTGKSKYGKKMTSKDFNGHVYILFMQPTEILENKGCFIQDPWKEITKEAYIKKIQNFIMVKANKFDRTNEKILEYGLNLKK